jgi:predicted nuclease of predicted toxin-antitoxin system
MRFLADENFPRRVAESLAALDYDVTSISELRPGASDIEVLSICMADSRTLLTLDKDFGELAWRRRLPATCGVVLFRLAGINSEEELILTFVSAIRSRPLPRAADS